MSNHLPTLNDYFDQIRQEKTTSPDTAQSLLVEYRGKAVRHRQRVQQMSLCGAALVVAGCCALFFLGPEFSPTVHNDGRRGTISHSMIKSGEPSPPSADLDGSNGRETAISPASPQSALREAGPSRHGISRSSTDFARTHNPQKTARTAIYSQASSYHDETEVAVTRPVSESTDSPDNEITLSNHSEILYYAVALPVEPVYQAELPSAHMMEPSPFAMEALQSTVPQRLGLCIGISYSTMQPDISAINRELSSLSYSAIPESFRQYSLYVAALLENFSIGVEYTPPSSASSTVQQNTFDYFTTDHPVISYQQDRWSLFANYIFPLLDNLSISTGAVVNLTAYELSFKKAVTGFAYDPSLSDTDDWNTLWAAAAGTGRVVQASNGKEAIYSQAIGIGPDIGINWQVLSFLAFHARLRYVINFDHNWNNRTSGDTVDGVNSLLKMNEYSVQIGASFSQWIL
jgi:hypothetical protein